MANILLIIDIQKVFLPDIDEQYISKVHQYLRTCKYDEIIATKFVNKPNSPYTKYLGWVDCMEENQKMELADEVTFIKPIEVIKNGYGLPDSIINKWQNDHVTVIGIDTDACVLSIVFKLFDQGIDFKVFTDLCYSTGGQRAHENAVELMIRQFGSAVTSSRR